MRVVSVRWSTYRIPLRDRFITAHSSMSVREGAIVELFTSRNDVVGIGEIAPFPEFNGGNLDDALTALGPLVNDLCGKTIEEALEYLRALLFAGHLQSYGPASRLPAATACGIEMALLDALGKMRNCSAGKLLCQEQDGMPRPRIPVNAVIGALEVAATVQQARQMVADGFFCLKIKMGNEDTHREIERVRAVRAAIGPAIQLRLDANEGWTFEQALAILTASAGWQIQYVEQPLPAQDIQGMSELQRVVPVPLAADEAVHDLDSIRALLRAHAAQVLVIKPQLVGGLDVSRERVRLASQKGLRSVITSVFETGIGLAALLHLVAASPEITWACGLATLDRLVDDLICESLAVRDGMIAVPDGPGLGIELDQAALLQYRCATGTVGRNP